MLLLKLPAALAAQAKHLQQQQQQQEEGLAALDLVD
jgi:hypothetical protein